MTPTEQLQQNMLDATQAENPGFQPGDEQRYASKFFNLNVTVTAPDGRTEQRNPKDCATNYGAHQLATVLSTCGRPRLSCLAVLLGPAEGWGWIEAGSFSDSEPVPYLQFRKLGDSGPPTGAIYNAAHGLDYLNSGEPAIRALNSIEAEVGARQQTKESSLRRPKTRSTPSWPRRSNDRWLNSEALCQTSKK